MLSAMHNTCPYYGILNFADFFVGFCFWSLPNVSISDWKFVVVVED